jgi:hypothetical protein
MASDGYTALAGGRDIYGRPWEVGMRRAVMVVTFGDVIRVFDDEEGESDGGATDRDRFAEAVARAVTPGQVSGT